MREVSGAAVGPTLQREHYMGARSRDRFRRWPYIKAAVGPTWDKPVSHFEIRTDAISALIQMEKGIGYFAEKCDLMCSHRLARQGLNVLTPLAGQSGPDCVGCEPYPTPVLYQLCRHGMLAGLVARLSRTGLTDEGLTDP
ncbi:hypothetical protein PGTUg99_028369 [Puccinia graminis f. sp. tritici]|uniref:Uncharacterized protein n=1 Tax=Puccinia graminis f. sp. tritici TaxID=56615 RepID=A0A5B0R9P7_PUCGR|nr:hypothetical protein PGTUg99_028369 [Puccinia graminis f. sp. tritici]